MQGDFRPPAGVTPVTGGGGGVWRGGQTAAAFQDLPSGGWRSLQPVSPAASPRLSLHQPALLPRSHPVLSKAAE